MSAKSEIEKTIKKKLRITMIGPFLFFENTRQRVIEAKSFFLIAQNNLYY
jgi:hypothetical protein